MLRIAICDDVQNQTMILQALVHAYLLSKNRKAEVRAFHHPDELLCAMEQEPFHIYILDILMPMLSGIEVGHAIRQQDRDAQIIYTTSSPDYALEAFSAHPVNYLLKPVDKDAFFSTLSLAISGCELKDEGAITIKTKTGLQRLAFSSIAYCEYARHTIIFTLLTGEKVETLTVRCSFGEFVAPLLADARFLQPHTSYVCNMNRIERVADNTLILRGDFSVPISKTQRKEVLSTYLDFMFKRSQPVTAP